MTQEQIERAADLYSANATPTFVDGCFARHATADAFEAGAQWRINSVWHPINEDPGYGKYILVHFKSGNFTSWFACADILSDFKRFEVEEWAYVVDLLPTEGK